MASSWGGGGGGGGGGGSFREIFEKPLPENPTLIESLSTPWKPKKPAEHGSFTELFGELHFKEPTYDSSSSSSLSPRPSWSPTSKDVNLQQPDQIEKLDDDKNNENKMKPSSDSLFGIQKNQYMKSFKSTGTGFSSKKAESLQLCTEGLGFESSDDVENSKDDETGDDWNNTQKGKMSITRDSQKGKMSITSNSSSSDNLNESRRLKTIAGSFPPPITCLGKNGKPWVCFKSFRYNGRFVLKEIEIPNKEILHACRKNGRLTLHLVQHDDEEIHEADEYDDAYEQEDEEEADEYDDANEQEGEGEEKKSEFSNVEVEGNP